MAPSKDKWMKKKRHTSALFQSVQHFCGLQKSKRLSFYSFSLKSPSKNTTGQRLENQEPLSVSWLFRICSIFLLPKVATHLLVWDTEQWLYGSKNNLCPIQQGETATGAHQNLKWTGVLLSEWPLLLLHGKVDEGFVDTTQAKVTGISTKLGGGVSALQSSANKLR